MGRSGLCAERGNTGPHVLCAPAGGSREEGRGLEPRKVKLRGGYRVGAEVPEDKDIGEEARKREASGWKDCPKSPGIM